VKDAQGNPGIAFGMGRSSAEGARIEGQRVRCEEGYTFFTWGWVWEEAVQEGGIFDFPFSKWRILLAHSDALNLVFYSQTKSCKNTYKMHGD